MIMNFSNIGCTMCLNVHIMVFSRLDKFKNNIGVYSEEQGERFHQDIMAFEIRYKGQYMCTCGKDSNKEISLQADVIPKD